MGFGRDCLGWDTLCQLGACANSLHGGKTIQGPAGHGLAPEWGAQHSNPETALWASLATRGT